MRCPPSEQDLTWVLVLLGFLGGVILGKILHYLDPSDDVEPDG